MTLCDTLSSILASDWLKIALAIAFLVWLGSFLNRRYPKSLPGFVSRLYNKDQRAVNAAVRTAEISNIAAQKEIGEAEESAFKAAQAQQYANFEVLKQERERQALQTLAGASRLNR